MEQLAKDLFETTASLASAIHELPGPNCTSELSTEVQFMKTVYSGVRERIDSSIEIMLKLGSELCDQKFTSVEDLRDDYKPLVSNSLDTMFETIDNALDTFKEIKDDSLIPQRPTEPAFIKKQVKRLQVEYDTSKISTPQGQLVFVPDQHPYDKLVKGLYKSIQDLPIIQNIPFEADLQKSPCPLITTPEELARMAATLQEEPFIAVDLEGHNFHSYHGFTCLMQISTQTNDYLIDTISLRSEIGRALGSVFADSAIVKVFHGAQGDIQWLQRDFNIFIVNMFDTYFASKKLAFGSHSLAYLLLRYCNVQSDKQYQLADWRTRPIPNEMLKYARMDTHYLLHIFSRMALELQDDNDKDALLSVFQQSTKSALALYRPETFDPNGWKSIVNKASVPYGEREISIIKAIYEWRDHVARTEDISPPAVLPNYIILRLAQSQSVIDPLSLLQTNKFPLKAAIKHVESLKSTIINRKYIGKESVESETIVSRKSIPPPPSSSTTTVNASSRFESKHSHSHLKFKDQKDASTDNEPLTKKSEPLTEASEPLIKISVQPLAQKRSMPPTIQIQTNKRVDSKISFASTTNSQTSSMASMFSTVQKRQSSDAGTAQKVMSDMSISKVAKAFNMLCESSSSSPSATVIEDETSSEPEEKDETKTVLIHRTERPVDAEEIIAAQKDQVLISLAKPQQKRKNNTKEEEKEKEKEKEKEIDPNDNDNILSLKDAASSLMTNATSIQSTKKSFASSKKAPFISTKLKAPLTKDAASRNQNLRLSSIPKSGNRAMTFRN